MIYYKITVFTLFTQLSAIIKIFMAPNFQFGRLPTLKIGKML